MSISKEGWLKIKLHDQHKWHRRYCTVDWDKAVLFIASRADTRYRHWIKLAPDIIVNDYEHLFYNEASNNNSNSLPVNTIAIKAEGASPANFLQAENKDDYDSWILILKRTAYSRNGGGIFGQSLEDTYKYSRDRSSLVPLIIRQCCEYIQEHGATFVGLFRVPGKQSSIREIRDTYDRGLPVELKPSYSPATVSSLLKNYLQSLPEPIIPTQYFDDFFEIGSRLKYSETNDLHHLKHVIETKLSNVNYAVLAYICLFLKKMSNHAEVTKMNTDNIAVVFGSNLIRPAEKLDLNMVKGHSGNLLPLIKALIDHSEYLFSGHSTDQFHDSYEQTIESNTKSSGCSSFSSLLSSNDHPITNKSRSTSMPSICITAFLTRDSPDFSPESSSAMEHDNRSVKSFIEKKNSSTSEDSNNRQLHSEAQQTDHQTSGRHSHLETKSNIRQKRFASIDFLDADQAPERIKHSQRSMDNILAPQERKLDCQLRPASTADITMPIRKMEKYQPKKGFANKFGKSFSTLKSSMSRALQSHASSNENDSQTIESPALSTTQQSENRFFAFPSSSNNSSKKLQSDIELLKDVLDRKDLIISELTKTSRDERMQFEKEIFQLNQKIEQLQYENVKLQKQLNRE